MVPIWPKKTLVLVLTLIAAFVVSLGFVLMSELTDDTLRRPEQVEAAIGVPVLGSVLHMDAWTAIYKGAIVFLPWDAMKAAVAAGLIPLAWRLIGRR